MEGGEAKKGWAERGKEEEQLKKGNDWIVRCNMCETPEKAYEKQKKNLILKYWEINNEKEKVVAKAVWSRKWENAEIARGKKELKAASKSGKGYLKVLFSVHRIFICCIPIT